MNVVDSVAYYTFKKNNVDIGVFVYVSALISKTASRNFTAFSVHVCYLWPGLGPCIVYILFCGWRLVTNAYRNPRRPAS